MYQFLLYDDERLTKFDSKKRDAIILSAIKNYRKDKPINLMQRIYTLTAISFVPALFILFFTSVSFSLAWFLASILIATSIWAQRETPNILPYIDKELTNKKVEST